MQGGGRGQEKEAFLSFFKRRLLPFFLSFVLSSFLPSFLPSPPLVFKFVSFLIPKCFFLILICSFFDPYFFLSPLPSCILTCWNTYTLTLCMEHLLTQILIFYHYLSLTSLFYTHLPDILTHIFPKILTLWVRVSPSSVGWSPEVRRHRPIGGNIRIPLSI